MFELHIGTKTLLEEVGYFFLFSFGGWLLEVAYAYVEHRKFVNRGFLFGPFCPIYGFGAVLMFGYMDYFLAPVRKFDSMALDILVIFVVITFMTTSVEYLAGWLLEKMFHQRWWDYSDSKFNINGYISLVFSVCWGAIGTIIYLFLTSIPFKLTDYLPKNVSEYLASAFIIYLVIDLTKSVDLGFRLRIFAREISEAAYELKEKLTSMNIDALKLETEIKKGQIKELRANLQEKFVALKPEVRLSLEKSLNKYEALLKKERVQPFIRHLKAFPGMTYRKSEGTLDALKDAIQQHTISKMAAKLKSGEDKHREIKR